ncbi:MAG: hypothetical protein IPL53_22880 [Ignavibacteria bacterium]|nr:hypothetical protein [Ignavibacteria bacterium]
MDTSHVLLSSQEFDYKNPQFDKSGGSLNYSIKDCILAYEKWSSPRKPVISVRFINYNTLGTETDLSDNSSLNINPAVAYFTDFSQVENGPGAVAFQSNRDGNWDIYISFYNSVSWSTPTAVGVTTENETEPCIVPYRHNNSLNYLLTFKRGSDIYVKNFFNGVWKDEVNLTGNDSLDCFSSEMTKTVYNDNQFFIAYDRKLSLM